jgi:hypothetical protein
MSFIRDADGDKLLVPTPKHTTANKLHDIQVQGADAKSQERGFYVM